MADESTDEGGEYVDPCIALGDTACWIADPELLIPTDEDATGDDQIVAVQFSIDRGLWYLTRKERWWHNAETKKISKLHAVKPA